ncbi:protein-glutamate O-methyltransferase [bacterium]|nr:protein-glutamate O-methyltransferase [bacterium]
MDRRTFNDFRGLIYDLSGISLSENKETLVSCRVNKRMRALDIKSADDYLNYVQDDDNSSEIVHLLDAISTNVTHFFRESGHFDFLKAKVSDWASNGQRRLRIWSAASSSGEEPYSIAISVLEALRGKNVDVKILATDISTRMLKIAEEGIYEGKTLEKVTAAHREKYFTRIKTPHGAPRKYRAKPLLRNMIVFERLNLSQPPFPMHGPFDIIFCRNVMIYFDKEVKSRLLADMYRLLRSDGYLMVGHAESLTGLISDFKIVGPSVYEKDLILHGTRKTQKARVERTQIQQARPDLSQTQRSASGCYSART